MKEKIIICLIMIFVVPIAGEFKFFPLEGTMRVSLGTPVFFFFLLLFKNSKPYYMGMIAGASSVLFRTFLSVFTDGVDIDIALEQNIAALFYYIIYGLSFTLFNVRKYYNSPMYIGLLGVAMEVLASLAESSIRIYYHQMVLTSKGFFLIVFIAFLRSYFVVGLFYLLILNELKRRELEQRQRNEQMLLHISNLYIEMVQMKKSLFNTEQLMKNCYQLYRSLLEEDGYSPAAKKILQIAGEAHDIKKDHQRIYAGLLKLMNHESISDFMSVEDLINVIISSNKSYAEILKKRIKFSYEINGVHPPYHAFSLLSLLNNLVSNSVEAIKEKGHIHIAVNREDHILLIKVADNGPGIPKNRRELIFHPGYTTKFDSSGKSSNGIGLTYVKNVVEDLGGTIQLDDDNDLHETTFILTIPIKALNKGEETLE